MNAALILLILMTSAGILLLGRYLARLLSTQILTPLAELRRAAAAIEEHTSDFNERGVHLALEDGDVDATVRIDRSEFTRVLKNLWENSSKYRRSADVNVRMSLAAEGGRLAIRCDDDGVGVAPRRAAKAL